MCFGLTKIWRRKVKKPSVNIAEKPISAWTSTTSRPTRAPASKPLPSLRLDAHTTAAATDTSPPVAKNEKPLATATPSKPIPSTYLSPPKPSYRSGAKSHRSSSNSHSRGTASSGFGSASYSISSYDYGSSCSSSSGGGGGGGGCGGSSGGGGGGCGGGGGGGC